MAAGRILVVTGNYQLGNNPGLFQEAPYVGLSLTLPVSISWVDQGRPDVKVYVETHDIETWGDWSGHPVLLNGCEIGRLKDPDNQFGRVEVFELAVPMAMFLAITGYTPGSVSKVRFQVVLEVQPAHPGLADDFVITRLETDDSVVMRLGW